MPHSAARVPAHASVRKRIVNILVVTADPVYPPRNAIAKRSLQLLSFLPARHSLDCLLLEMTEVQSGPVMSSLAEWGSNFYDSCRRVVHFPIERSRMNLHYGFVWYSRAFERCIARLLRENHYDVVLGISVNMAYYLRRVRSVPVVVDLNDADEMACWREIVNGSNLRNRARAARNLVLFQLFRRRVLARHRHLVVVSDVDAAFLSRQLKRTVVHVVPLGPEPHFFAPVRETEIPNVVMFHGSLSAPHNRDAARVLLREIHPGVLRERPETELWIVGPGMDGSLAEFARSLPNVRLTGHVPDVKPLLEQAAVYVCPHATGSGMKTKMLEAWALGKATVATPRALGGLRAADGVNTLIAKTPVEFAAAVARLIRDPGLRRTLGRNAREAALKNYSAERLSAMLEQLLTHVAGSPQTSPEWDGHAVLQEQ
jgi:glycosyltransferase involved in cell wall biosynthesis